ncbi:MAG: hypothetical protein SF187_08335 [Deltaproteobacteria bacterium]|nr:hypothetical protein [Deltaproteobacteria bacterium]
MKWVLGSGISQLALPAGVTSGVALAVNSNGSVIVGGPLRWNALGVDQPFGAGRQAKSVDNNGGTISGSIFANGNPNPWVWNNGSVTDISALGDAYVSGDGKVVAGGNPLGIGHFRYSSSSGVVPMDNAATALNYDGGVIVGGPYGWPPFRWTAAAGFTTLPTPSGYDPNGWSVKDVSADGTVIVGSIDKDSAPNAVIYDTVNGTRLLSNVLQSAGVDTQGWTLEIITGIAADGTSIVGNGTDGSGGKQSFRAVLP